MRKLLLTMSAVLVLAPAANAQQEAADIPPDPSKCVNGHAPPLIGGNGGYEIAGPCSPQIVRDAAESIGMGRTKPIGIKHITTLAFTAVGSIADDQGRMQPVSRLVAEFNYTRPAARMLIERANGTEVRVFSSNMVWNEASPGLGATAAPAAAWTDRSVMPKLTPQGAMWSIVEAEQTVQISTVGGKTVLKGASPIDGIPVTVTLDAMKRPERVQVVANGQTYEATFQNYIEENPAYMVVFPTKLVWTKGGRPLADLSVGVFRSNQRVFFPVPAVATAAAPAPTARRLSPLEVFQAGLRPQGTTPRLPDGKPDLNGALGGFPSTTGPTGRRSNAAFEPDQAITIRSRESWDEPPYKAENWKTVVDGDFGKVDADPGFGCNPPGVPRQGPPTNIIQTAKELWLYNGGRIRQVRVDNFPRGEFDDDESNYNGVPRGRWEGDTLVIESTGFTDNSWLGWTGQFHSNRMKVTEWLRRDGNLLHWKATVFDPETMTAPWQMEPQVRRFVGDSNIPEATVCLEKDLEHMADPYFRG